MADLYGSVAGAGGKTGADWANALDQTQFQASAVDVLVAGETFYVEAVTYTLAGIFDVDSGNDGTAGNLISVVAVNASTHINDGSRAIWDAGSTHANCFNQTTAMNYWSWENHEFINATGDGWNKGDALTSTFMCFKNCAFDNNGGKGFDANGTRVQSSTLTICQANGNTTVGIDVRSGSVTTAFCQTLNNGNDGIRIGSAINCLSHNNTVDGIDALENVDGCTIDGNSVGARANYMASSNRFTNNDWTLISNSALASINNGFYNSGTVDYSGTFTIKAYDLALTSDGYTNRGADDFTLTIGGEGVGVAIAYGLLDEATNIGYYTQGLPPEYSGGGGGGGGQLINGSLIE